MLKYLLPLTLLFSISTSSLAQDTFAPIGAKWWYTPWYSAPNCAFYTLESVGDTLVNGQFARILEYRYIEELVPEATRSESILFRILILCFLYPIMLPGQTKFQLNFFQNRFEAIEIESQGQINYIFRDSVLQDIIHQIFSLWISLFLP